MSEPEPSAARPPALVMRGISKSFGTLQANSDIDFDLDVGEIHGLLGENGAGKSTLMNILFGLLTPDAGTIEVFGSPVTIGDPSTALRLGIGMVHQHFMLIPAFTVAENLVLGGEPRRRLSLDTRRAAWEIGSLAERTGLAVDPDARVADLGVAARQRVEILRALYRGARILVLDEPTAVLTPQESDGLLSMLTAMAASGLSVILISHKLSEQLLVTSRITVLRDGRLIGTVPSAGASTASLAAMMVGRETDLSLEVPPVPPSAHPLLEVRGVTEASGRVRGIDLAVRGGEIVGVAGVEGSGQRELVEIIAGLRQVTDGQVVLDGVDITRHSPLKRLARGLAYVPEDRSTEGLVLDLPVYENAILRRQQQRSLRRFGLLSRRRARQRAAAITSAYDVRPAGVAHPARALSGGNQQKLLIGREIHDEPPVLVVSQPTRGVDIAAATAIHRRLLDARSSGRAVLLDSLDLDEVKALCDRILVMFRGEIAGSLRRGAFTDEALGLLMTGAQPPDSRSGQPADAAGAVDVADEKDAPLEGRR